MNQNEAPKFEDDFEIIQENNNRDESSLNESTHPGRIESKNMEDGESLPTPERPVAPKRTHTPASGDYKKIHLQRESRWNKEKEQLLANTEKYRNDVKEKEVEISLLQEQKEKQEERNDSLVNEVQSLKAEKEELEKRINHYEAKMEEDCEKIKELEEKSEESEAGLVERNKELEKLVVDLRRSLQEKEESLNDASKNENVFANREEQYQQAISHLENNLAVVTEELANTKEQVDEKSRKINELESTNMQLQENRSQEEDLIKKNEALKGSRDLHEELLSIHNDMEEELHKSRTDLQKATQENQRILQQNQQILQQKDEIIRESEERYRTESEKLNNSIREMKQEKDDLESQLVAVKLSKRSLSADKDSQRHEIEELINKNISFCEERDFYATKCKELEEGMKLNADREINKLKQALEELIGENDVLRKRINDYHDEITTLKNAKMATEEKVERFRASGGDLGRENGGFSRSLVPNGGPFRQKPINLEEENTSPEETSHRVTATSTQQWYEAGEGTRLFGLIYEELHKIFSTIEISRAVSTKDISLLITTDVGGKFNVNFPENFPNAPASVMHNGRRTEFMSGRGKSATDICKEMVKMLCELAYG